MNGDAIPLTALDAATGRVLWTYGSKGARLSVCFSPANELVVCVRGTGICELDPSTGATRSVTQLEGDWQGCAVVPGGQVVAWEPSRLVALSRGRVAWQWTPPEGSVGGFTSTGDRELAVALTTGQLVYLTIGGETALERKRIVVSDRALSWPVSTPDGEVVVVDVEGDVFVCGAERAWAVQLDGRTGAFPRPAVGPDGRVYVGGRDAVYCLTGARPPETPVRAKSLTLMADDFVVDVWVNGQRVPDASRRMHNEVFGAMGERITVDLRAGDWIVFNVVNNRLRWGGVAYFAVDFADEQGRPVFWTQDDGSWSACDDVSQVAQFILERDSGASVRARVPANVWTDGTAYLERELGRKFPGEPVWGASRNTWIKHVVR